MEETVKEETEASYLPCCGGRGPATTGDECYIKIWLAGRFGIKSTVKTTEWQGVRHWPRAPLSPDVWLKHLLQRCWGTQILHLGSILHRKVFLMVTFHTNFGMFAIFNLEFHAKSSFKTFWETSVYSASKDGISKEDPGDRIKKSVRAR